ncbi:hypothetical protein [Sedimenticola selenatireducens]|uniref:Glycosyltransferase family 1 protein n=1 Tax=Sedimenticola selenatireducens TaxID=191960 RepID=A0A557S4U2_9GAMM|nr:hypothetical protein [Sedimenticola selenatireducens]TVO72436.1 hypothetical protein FHP88_12635 [Sedimenticola selenatireducens]TVT64691.1 MAG: hypothetical protein FHK78_06400 [Sedimenticola selenatireducens]
MRILILYDKYSTFTNTVFDHLDSFSEYSSAEVFYYQPGDDLSTVSLEYFDAVVIHYSLRIPLGQLTAELYHKLNLYAGLKVLFVQDEYDYTDTVRKAIHDLEIGLVFTCVPEKYIDTVYPSKEFTSTCFVNNLTGYIPASLANEKRYSAIRDRPIFVGYRGRSLPFWYGDLGQEKFLIAQFMKGECRRRAIASDIEWEDKNRIYGGKWVDFLSSCKATLGTESGSNVFDDSGKIREKVNEILRRNSKANYAYVRKLVFGGENEVLIMNQISPRFFESIALKTGLILYEGEYSGILEPYKHFIPLRKDHENIDEVFQLLIDDTYMQAMVDRAYEDIIESDKYSYSSFIKMVDSYISNAVGSCVQKSSILPPPPCFTVRPQRVRITRLRSGLTRVWSYIPYPLRNSFRPLARRVAELVSRSD